MRRAAGFASLFAVLSASCVEEVELARVPDAAAAVDAPLVDLPLSDRLTDTLDPDAARTDAPVTDAPLDVSDASVDVVEELADASTLLVQAALTARSELGMPREWQTEIDVTVTRGGASVTGVAVSWNTPLGVVMLLSDDGHFRGVRNGYPAWSELTVTAPGERPPAQRWSTPEAHAISSPRDGENHAALTPLDVLWAPTGAAEAQFTAPAFLPAMADTGRATVPAMYFPRDSHTVVVRLRRRTSVSLDSFAIGSTARNDVVAPVSVSVP